MISSPFARITALVALSAAGCSLSSEEAVGESRSAKVIGENDLTPVVHDGANIPEKYRPLIDAFGLIEFKHGADHCTATHSAMASS